jgi:hypothetical protein
MKNLAKWFGIIALAAIIGLSFAACGGDDGSGGSGGGGGGGGNRDLSGTITITPNSGVETGTKLTATYSGSEVVSYQWKKDGGNAGANAKEYTPAEAGSYTVTVSATGYNSKTSAAVTVTRKWVDPATQTTQLTGGSILLSYTGGNKSLTGSPYGYETWDFSQGNSSANTFTWYGANQGGGGAFKATWTSYFLARLGYYWGNGGQYTQYKNIYADYNFKRSANNGSPDGGFIGIYGWSRNPSAAKDIEKLIEYYIVDDWFWNEQCGPGHIGGWDASANQCEELGSFTVDGATYKIYKNPRINEPSIDGTKTFIQIFSVRQGRRTFGTISVTEHFKEWSKYITLGSMYEAKFKVEAFGKWDGTVNGYLDLTYLYLAQEDKVRTNTPVPKPDEEILVGNYTANNSNPHVNLYSSSNYSIINLPGESKTNVMKVVSPSNWTVAQYDLSSKKDQRITVTFSANIKRAGAAGNLNWQINNSDYPSVGNMINNASAGIWHSMSGTWTGIPTAEYPAFYLSTYENNSGSTTYYIDSFSITIR